MFEIQEHQRSGEISIDSITVMEELVQVWEYAGYGDIFQDIYSIKRNISTLYGSCNKLMLCCNVLLTLRRRAALYLPPLPWEI